MRRVVSVVTIGGMLAALSPGASSLARAKPDGPGRGACGPSWTVAAQPPPGSGGSELFGVVARSASDAWTVGYRFDPDDGKTHTLVRHWDGSVWQGITAADGPSGDASILEDAATIAGDDAWAVGSYTTANNLLRSLAEHWDGTAWSRVKTPNVGSPHTGTLSGVATLATDDAWAVGSTSGQGGPSRTLIEHWDGATWSVVPSPNKGPYPNALSDVTAIAPDDVWAVGTWFTKAFDGRTLVLHWDGTSWKKVVSPNVGSKPNVLADVSATATDDVWAVGFHALKTLAIHWDGTSWSVVPTPNASGNNDLSGVAARAAGDVWAVGGLLDDQTHSLRTLTMHWDGNAWTIATSANQGPSDNHLAAVAITTTRQFAAGYRFNANGTRISPLVLERCSA